MVCLAVGVIGRLLRRRLCRLLHRRLWVTSPRHRGLDDLPSFLLSCHPCCCWIRRLYHSPRCPSCRRLRTSVPLPPSSALHHCRGLGDLSSRSSGPCSSRSRGRSRDPLLGAPVVDSVAADVSGGFDLGFPSCLLLILQLLCGLFDVYAGDLFVGVYDYIRLRFLRLHIGIVVSTVLFPLPLLAMLIALQMWLFLF